MSPSDEKVVDLYCNKKLSIAQTAKLLKMSDGFVRRALKRKNVKPRSLSEGRKVTTGVTDEQILNLYNQGWAMRKISEHFGKSKNFAEYRIKAMGIKDTRQIGFYNKQRARLDEEQEKNLCNDYKNGMGVEELKEKYKIYAHGTLEKYNIALRGQGKDQVGPKNPHWKGGISPPTHSH